MFTVHYYDLRVQTWKQRDFQLIAAATEFIKRKKCLVRIERALPSGNVQLFSGPARKFSLLKTCEQRDKI